jgi:mercuric ion transport protein
MNAPAPESASMAAGLVSALGASACCVLPLALVSVGLGGAWIAQLRAMERYSPIFICLAIVTFGYAFFRLYVHPVPCAAQTACAPSASRRRQRIAFWSTFVVANLLILFPFVYGSLAG